MSTREIHTSQTGHTVQFYEDDDFLCGEVARFLAAGLQQGETALVVAGEKHRRGVASALEAGGVQLEALRADGRLLELDAEETLERFMLGTLRDGMPDEPSFQRVVGGLVQSLLARSGSPGLRAFGEMVDLLVEHGNGPAALQLEALWNELRRIHSFQLFCAYSMGHFGRAEDAETFRCVCDAHALVHPHEGYAEDQSEQDKGRHIADLQQRAGALEAEIALRKRLERSLREEHARLEEADRRKDEFIAILSHELRNPLAPILTALDVMDVRGDTGSKREREIIRRQARHLSALVEDLLDVSRLARGTVTLQKEFVELSSIADTAIEMTASLFTPGGPELEVSIPAAGLPVEADTVRLPQAFANLLTNAARFSQPHGRVGLKAERSGSEVVVTVEDEGVGIVPERLEEIFTPFVQGRQGNDRSAGGLGLGLAVVRALVDLHGGNVHAESGGAGKGSRFVVRLPIARAGAPRRRRTRPENGSAVHERAAKNGHGRSAKRILVVDDNRDAAHALGDLVERLGYSVRIAHDGVQALELARGFSPDIALVDIGLPTMDGYMLAPRLRRILNGVHLRLIAVTGYGEPADRARSARAGFDAHLIKPVALHDLRPVLENSEEIRPNI